MTSTVLLLTCLAMLVPSALAEQCHIDSADDKNTCPDQATLLQAQVRVAREDGEEIAPSINSGRSSEDAQCIADGDMPQGWSDAIGRRRKSCNCRRRRVTAKSATYWTCSGSLMVPPEPGAPEASTLAPTPASTPAPTPAQCIADGDMPQGWSDAIGRRRKSCNCRRRHVTAKSATYWTCSGSLMVPPEPGATEAPTPAPTPASTPAPTPVHASFSQIGDDESGEDIEEELDEELEHTEDVENLETVR